MEIVVVVVVVVAVVVAVAVAVVIVVVVAMEFKPGGVLGCKGGTAQNSELFGNLCTP